MIDSSEVFVRGCNTVIPFTFGKRISLTVTPKDDSAVEPAMFVLSPLLSEEEEKLPADKRGPEVCLAADFRPQVGTLVLNAKEGSFNVSTSKAVLSSQEKTYFYAAFTNQTLHSCMLHGTPANNEIIELCTDVHPERAKLNYLLLVMNAVRVVFTKTLAFNTILTIRAMLF